MPPAGAPRRTSARARNVPGSRRCSTGRSGVVVGCGASYGSGVILGACDWKVTSVIAGWSKGCVVEGYGVDVKYLGCGMRRWSGR